MTDESTSANVLADPMTRLRHANAASEAEALAGTGHPSERVSGAYDLPSDTSAFTLDGKAMFEAGISPLSRLNFQGLFEALAAERKRRSEGHGPAMDDADYFAAATILRPYATPYTQAVLFRMLTFRSPS